MRPLRLMIGAVVVVYATGCDADSTGGPPADGRLAVGTWGGDSAGVIVADTLTHVHIGCTYGDIPRRVVLDADGRFTVAGSFLLRAYPVAIGPTMPAQFSGRVSGSTLTITVTVNDTIEGRTVIRGPASVRFGTEPKLGPCPICVTPGDRSSARMRPTPAGWQGRVYAAFIALFSRRAPGAAATPPTHSPPANRPAESRPRQ